MELPNLRNAVWEQRASGLIVPAPELLLPDRMRGDASVEVKEPIRAVDLFAGCGGFSLGMHMAGIDVIAAVEWEPNAVMTYLSNLGSPRGCAVAYVADSDKARLAKVLQRDGESQTSGWIGRHNRYPGEGCRAMVMGDASLVTGDMIREALAATKSEAKIDVVFGGPPCQGMSSAGKQQPDDPRNNLVLEFVRIADELGASVFVMENVPPLITQLKFRPLFDEFVRRAHVAGFNVTANVLDAANYGVPQRRRRAFVVGTRGKAANKTFSFAMPTHWAFVHNVGEKTPISFLDGEPEADEVTKAARRARRPKPVKARKRRGGR